VSVFDFEQRELLIVRGVRALKGMFGSDSSKSTNFCPEVTCGRHIDQIQNGRHPIWCRSQFKNLQGYNNNWYHILGILMVGETWLGGWQKNGTSTWQPLWSTLSDASVACSILLHCGCNSVNSVDDNRYCLMPKIAGKTVHML